MPTPWQVLETIPGPAAVPAIWRTALGAEYDLFRKTFLRVLSAPATSYPCPRECGCAHEIVRHRNGTIVAVCRCDPCNCDDIRLTEPDITILELNWKQLGRAVAKALGLKTRDAATGVDNTIQIAAFASQAIPVILTIQTDRVAFRQVVSALAARLRGPFLLIAPTADFMDAPSKDVLTGACAAFLPLDPSLVLTPQGTLRATRDPEALLAAIKPDEKEPPPQDVALGTFRLVEALDSERPMKAPTIFTVFKMYCIKCMTTDEIARKTGCSKGTVINRLDALRKQIGDPKKLQRYSPQFNKINDDIAASKGSYVHRKSLIYDDAGQDEES